jgi:hypothetical protein
VSGPITAEAVRYIKFGRGGDWEKECIEGGIARFGYATERPSRFAMALEGRWEDLREAFLADGQAPGTATRFTRDTRHFFADAQSTLWITFYRQLLWWAFLDPAAPERHADGRGTFRRVVGAWRDSDRIGSKLSIDRLSGSLTKIAAYRSTTFALDPLQAEYVIRRVNGERSPTVEQALAALAMLRQSTRELLGLLEPRDFELLVDLIFTSSGWRRIGAVGGAQKTLDMDVVLPSTGERAFIQVKSRATNAELSEYIAQLDDLGPYRRMFFVYHTGSVTDPEDDRVVVIGPEQLAALVLDAGLADWLIARVS